MNITSPQNQSIKQVRAINAGKAKDKFILEGEKWLTELDTLGIDAEYFVMSYSFAQNNAHKSLPRYYVVDDSTYAGLTSTVTPLGILAVCNKTTYSLDAITLPPSPFVLMLDNISDPGNLGTIIRSAVAFGCQLIITSKGSVSIYNDKVLRSTAGAIFKLPIVEGLNISQDVIPFLKSNNIHIVGTSPHTTNTFYDINTTEGVCIILGNEAHGMSKDVLEICDLLVKIPIVNIESLNVSVACGIILQEVCRQRTIN